MRRNYVFGAVLLVLLVSSTVFATDTNTEIFKLQQGVVGLQNSFDQGIITEQQYNDAAQWHLDQVATLTGSSMTLDELKTFEWNEEVTGASRAELTRLQRAAGFVTFVNIAWVIGIGLLVVCTGYLFGSWFRFLRALFGSFPLAGYELLCYAGSIGLITWGSRISESSGHYFALTGCLLFAAALLFSASTRKLEPSPKIFFGVLCVLWTGVALMYASSLIGFFAVIAFMGMVGFIVGMSPLTYFIGFDDEEAVLPATFAAFLVLGLYVIARVKEIDTTYFSIFESGALFMGSFVGFLGLLIASSKWYRNSRKYWTMQFVTIVAGCAALYIGSVYGIGELLKIGGTFFVLYLLEKMCEIPVRHATGYAYLGLCIAIVIFAFCMVVRDSPDTFRPYLLF